MADVFLSYASPDREIAFKIAAFLEGTGISCWVAPRDVPPGMEYGAAIIHGIETSRALVLVLSEHSNDSHFVRKEVERAVSKVKPVLPVRIREVNPSGSLEFFISSAQWVDAWRAPMESHLDQLAVAIRAIAGSPPLPGTVTLARPAPRSSRRWPVAAAVLLVALLGAAGVWAWQPWLPTWQRAPTSFLAGSWCQPMSGEAFARLDFVAAGNDTAAGETHFSHSTAVERYRVHVAPTAEGLELTYVEPPEAVSAGPTRYRVLDAQSMKLEFAGGEKVDLATMSRCPARKGG